MNNIKIDTPYYFISSAQADSEQVLPVIAFLKDNKINTWYDTSIIGGAEWADSTMTAIDDSEGIIALISRNYDESKHCNRELHMASGDELNKKIIPIYLSETTLSSDLKHIVNGKDTIFKYKLTDKKFHSDLLAILAGVNVAPITMARPKPSSNEEKFAKAMALVNGNKAATAAPMLKELSSSGYHNATCSLANMYLTGVGVDKNLKKALELHTIASEKKVVKSLYALGIMYLNGNGVKANRDKALDYLDRAASLGDNNTAMTLADWYSTGVNAPKDPQKALTYYEVCASRGVSDGMYCAGMAYYFGNGAKQDYNRAFEYFTKACKANNADGAYMTALCLIKGSGVAQDIPQAITLLEQIASPSNTKANILIGDAYSEIGDYAKAFNAYALASQNNDDSAKLILAHCYANGQGVAVNYDTAIEIYTALSESGNITAKVELALCQFFGRGLAQDMNKAFKAITSLEKHHQTGEVYYALGLFYTQKIFSKFNYAKAQIYFNQAVELGDTRAKFELGKMLFYGYLGKVDYAKAFELFKESASLLSPSAYYYIGVSYFHSLGAPRDYTLAFANLKKAYARKVDDSSNLLGICYYYGLGATKDYPNAYACFINAFKNGSKAGACNASICALLGKGAPKNSDRAIQALQANTKNSVECIYALAECYAKGYGLEANMKKAEELYEEAGQYGYPPALKKLSDIYRTGGVTIKKSNLKSSKYAQDYQNSTYLVETILFDKED